MIRVASSSESTLESVPSGDGTRKTALPGLAELAKVERAVGGAIALYELSRGAS